MFNNEIEELILTEQIEVPTEDRRTRSDAPYMGLNANMFKLYTQCKYKVDAPDTVYRNLNQIICFEGLSSDDEGLGDKERAAVAMYEALAMPLSFILNGNLKRFYHRKKNKSNRIKLP